MPFPPEAPASGLADTNFHPVVWYRRTFQVQATKRQNRLLLHFGVVELARRSMPGEIVNNLQITTEITSFQPPGN